MSMPQKLHFAAPMQPCAFIVLLFLGRQAELQSMLLATVLSGCIGVDVNSHRLWLMAFGLMRAGSHSRRHEGDCVSTAGRACRTCG